MIRALMIVSLLALTLAVGCKTDDEATADPADPSTEQTAQTTGAAETPDETSETSDEEAAADPSLEGRFGGLVAGATTVTVTQRQPDGEADFGGTERVVDDAPWIEKFVAAVGPRIPGSEAVPRCLPNYTLKFAGEDGELATFGAVCAGSDSVILVRGGSSYTATDSATAREMLRALAQAPAQ